MHLRFTIPFTPEAKADSFHAGLPAAPAVFALFPPVREGVPAHPYIGRTTDLRRRLARLLSAGRPGSRMLNLRDVTARVEYQPVGSAFEASWLLYAMNRHYFARQYRERLRLRPPALLKLKMENRFPRCYATRRMANDGSRYYGPFASMAIAERFAGEFLDFFKIRRCSEELTPDPSHPGCIYSQLQMCLAPCFAGCTGDEYQSEVQRVVEFLDSQGKSLRSHLENSRTEASESMEFERASKIHLKIEKLNDLLRQRSDLVRNICELNAVMLLPGAGAKAVVLFRIIGGHIRGPAALSFDENVFNPTPLDRQLQDAIESVGSTVDGAAARAMPVWEHLSLLARWYYSSFRQGEIVLLNQDQSIPHSRLIRICRKLVSSEDSGPT